MSQSTNQYGISKMQREEMYDCTTLQTHLIKKHTLIYYYKYQFQLLPQAESLVNTTHNNNNKQTRKQW